MTIFGNVERPNAQSSLPRSAAGYQTLSQPWMQGCQQLPKIQRYLYCRSELSGQSCQTHPCREWPIYSAKGSQPHQHVSDIQDPPERNIPEPSLTVWSDWVAQCPVLTRKVTRPSCEWFICLQPARTGVVQASAGKGRAGKKVGSLVKRSDIIILKSLSPLLFSVWW